MIEISHFELRYFSEVSADILYRYRPEYNTYKISATHPRNNVPISDWFHFVESNVTAKDDPAFFEDKEPVKPLARMAGFLSPGAENVLETRQIDEPRRQFFSDFMSAIFTGEYDIRGPRTSEYTHSAGDWLLREYENLDVDRKI